MTLVSTKTPIFDDIPSIQFFNGRLLTGEDLSTEQAWNAARRTLLGKAIGSGIAFGLNVELSNKPEHVGKPIVSVHPGLAVNGSGELLNLTQQMDVSLEKFDENLPRDTQFSACLPTQYGVYTQSDGVYLLSVCPASGTQGRALVSGLANEEARCNHKYRREGVQFRLHQMNLTPQELAQRDYLRNVVAFKCFGSAAWKAFATDPFGAPRDDGQIPSDYFMPKLIESEVPLALIHWTTQGGIQFVDTWSVRRRLQRSEASDRWSTMAVDGRLAVAEAQFAQFQMHVETLRNDLTINMESIIATDIFKYLPPVGILPIATAAMPRGFHPDLFFAGITHHPVVHVEGARLSAIVRAGQVFPAYDLASGVSLWHYRIRENAQAESSNKTQPYLVFCSGHMAYMGDPHFDVNRWNFGNWI